jgi:hypothetical protein
MENHRQWGKERSRSLGRHTSDCICWFPAWTKCRPRVAQQIDQRWCCRHSGLVGPVPSSTVMAASNPSGRGSRCSYSSGRMNQRRSTRRLSLHLEGADLPLDAASERSIPRRCHGGLLKERHGWILDPIRSSTLEDMNAPMIRDASLFSLLIGSLLWNIHVGGIFLWW